jgi:hypothetical protein
MKMRQISSNTTAARTPTVIPSNTGVKFPKMKKILLLSWFSFCNGDHVKVRRDKKLMQICSSVQQGYARAHIHEHIL